MRPVVWLVSGDLPPRFAGGVANDLVIAPRLAALGIDVTIVGHDSGARTPTNVTGLPVVRIAGPATPFGGLRYPLSLLARVAAAASPPDLIRFRGFGTSRAVAIQALRFAYPRVRIVCQPACFGVDEPSVWSRTGWRRFGSRLRLRALLGADGVLAMNPSIAASVRAAGYPPTRLRSVRNPVDTDRYQPASGGERLAARQRLGLHDDAPLVVTLGGLSARKGQALVTAAIAAIGDRTPSRPWLIHAGPRADELAAMNRPAAEVTDAATTQVLIRDLAAAAGIADRVLVRGREADPRLLFAAADFYIHAATLEGEANALNEAMACGLTCIVPTAEVFAAQVHEGAYVAYPPNDTAALAAVVTRLLADRELARALGEAARRHVVATRAVDIVAADYAECLRQVAAAPLRSEDRR